MNNLIALMCFAGLILVALIAFAMMRRFGRGGSSAPYSAPGNETPRFDDPSISSGGSFGGAPVSSGTPIGSNRTSGGLSVGGSKRVDDPNVRSGGSFGG